MIAYPCCSSFSKLIVENSVRIHQYQSKILGVIIIRTDCAEYAANNDQHSAHIECPHQRPNDVHFVAQAPSSLDIKRQSNEHKDTKRNHLERESHNENGAAELEA